ncbi:MAG TPA: hypothetical protein VGJ21_03875 [Terracidiphilus sp.]
MDGALVRGNSTLFEGNVVETAGARSVLQLGGTQVTLLPESRAAIYHDRTVLQKGSLLSGAGRLQVEAIGLRIAPSAANSSIQVEIPSIGHVAVSARDGGAEVHNQAGILVASLRAGMALAFEPRASAPEAVQVTGRVQASNGEFFVTDETTRVTSEIVGIELGKDVGKRVQVNGEIISSAPVGAATQVVRATNRKILVAAAAGGGVAGAGAAGAGAATAGGLSTIATAAIIGGVAVSGTVVGLAASGTFSGSSASPK